jgi:hypothetical protein
MLFFPSLHSSAVVQLPSGYETSVRVAEVRTISNKSYWYLDTAQREKIWHLQYRSLTDEERATLSDFYRSTGGCLRTFTFLSPFENLLSHSSLTSVDWSTDAQLSIQAGEADPSGSTSAVRVSNPSLIAGRLRRNLEAPGWWRYTSSIYVRSQQAAALRLNAISGSGSASVRCISGAEWARSSFTFASLSPSSVLETEIEIQPLTEVYLYGPQLEVSAVATIYKPTEDRGGIYSNCRFLHDTLRWQTEAPNCHSTTVDIMARI